jgi:hypothetical protein
VRDYLEQRRNPTSMQLMDPLGGVERPGRAVRFARLIHRRGRVLGGPAVRAAFGGNLRLACLLLRGVEEATAFLPPVTRSLVASG